MSTALARRMPQSRLKAEALAAYLPFRNSTQWQYNLAQYIARGDKLVVHATFVGADKGKYRTNFAFVKQGDSWLIDQILPPTKGSRPTAHQGNLTVAPGG